MYARESRASYACNILNNVSGLSLKRPWYCLIEETFSTIFFISSSHASTEGNTLSAFQVRSFLILLRGGTDGIYFSLMKCGISDCTIRELRPDRCYCGASRSNLI